MYSSLSFFYSRALTVSICLFAFLGCNSKPGRLAVPKVNANRVAGLAVRTYDRDGDGILNSEELQACPSLMSVIGEYDTDHDGSLSQHEIAAGIGRWAESRKAAFSLPFRVELDGRPLEGAEVKLVPEDFLEGAVKPARGIAEEGGNGFVDLAPEDRPPNAPRMAMVPPGLYRVEITHPTISLPGKYNTQTTLGVETSIASQRPGGVVWTLRSRD